MLVLQRFENESVVIAPGTPNEVTVTILKVNGNRVRVGIDAPQSIEVNRLEVQIRKDANAGSKADSNPATSADVHG